MKVEVEYGTTKKGLFGFGKEKRQITGVLVMPANRPSDKSFLRKIYLASKNGEDVVRFSVTKRGKRCLVLYTLAPRKKENTFIFQNGIITKIERLFRNGVRVEFMDKNLPTTGVRILPK